MEYFQNETSGLWVVTLSGTRWDNCTVDAHCPGFAICMDAAWAQDDKTCMCPLGRLMDGPLCNEVTSLGLFETCYYSIMSCIVMVLVVVGVHAFYTLMRASKNQLDAAAMSLLLACLAAIAQAILYPSLAAAPWKLVEADPTTGKRDASNILSQAFVPVVFLLTTLAAMNVSLVWIKIADNALRMKQNASVDLINFRRAVFVYYTFLLTGMVGSMAARAYNWLIVVAMIGIIVVILTYIMALYKLHALILQFSSQSNSREADSEDAPPAKNTRAMMSDRGSKDMNNSSNDDDKVSPDQLNGEPSSPHRAKPASPRPASLRFSSPASKQSRVGVTRAKETADNMKYALRNIRKLSVRILLIGLSFLGFLSAYLTTSPSTPSPATNVILGRAMLGGCFLETTLLTAFVMFYVRDTTKRKVKTLTAAAETVVASAVVIGGSAMHPMSKQSSKITSTREEVVVHTAGSI